MMHAFLGRYVPLGILLAAFLWSASVVFSRTWGGAAPHSDGAVTDDRIVLRLAHWQLETGARDALDELARQYEALHPEVHIEQNAIPDSAYGMWLTTQLTSGTAPDLVQLDAGAPASTLIPWHVWQGFLQRYFVHMTPFAAQPNPYNAGTDLEGIPLRHTLKDGMRRAYSVHFLEYFAIPLSRFSFRVYYNKDLYEELTGRDTPPANWREFAAACEAISSRRDENGERYVPIANSKIHLPAWEGVADVLTHETVYLADFNHDCFIHNQELWQAIHTERITFRHPSILARFRMMRQIAEFSQEGFTGLMRDDAVFLYVQQRAVFLVVGTNEARSIAAMTEVQPFGFGVMELPYADADDPDFGEFARYGKPIEESLAATLSGFMFGIAQTSQHPAEALDFLLYMAGQEGNEELNRIVGWLPLTKGAASDDQLRQFEPRVTGVAGGLGTWVYAMGAETKIKYDQLYALYLIGQISLDEFLGEYDKMYRDKGLYDFQELLDAGRNERGNAEKLLAQMRSKAQTAQGDTAASHWSQYRQLMWQSQVLSEAVNAQIRRNLELGPVPGQKAPWDYTDFALDSVRKRIAAELDAE